jgi:hypothetical protein
MRQIPDVAFDAAPSTGVAVYDTHGYSGRTGWFVFGGTSFSAPAWAALLAISNEGRLLAQKGTLINRQAMDALYHLPASAFHDIVSGNNGSPATPGYDLVTGRGTPIANKLAADLVAASPAALSDVTSAGVVGAGSPTSPVFAAAATAIPPVAFGASAPTPVATPAPLRRLMDDAPSTGAAAAEISESLFETSFRAFGPPATTTDGLLNPPSVLSWHSLFILGPGPKGRQPLARGESPWND